VSLVTARTALWLLLAPEAYAGVEYSYGEDPEGMGIMLRPAEASLARIAQWAASVDFAGDWWWAAQRLVEQVRPTAYLFRTDWRGGDRLTGATLYCRFPREPTDEEFTAAARHAYPAGWHGPAPSAPARVLGVPGPRGVAIRAGESGRLALAVYYVVPTPASSLSRQSAAALLEACGIAAVSRDDVADAVGELYRGGSIGVVGLDDGADGRAGALKLNPANVPFAAAREFLGRRAVASTWLDQLGTVARDLRADHASYLGVRYTDRGMDGWRLYFSVEPARVPSPLAPQIAEWLRPLPSLRSPQH
jgi:hypothetical protein